MTVAAWTIAGDEPTRLPAAAVGLESNLESWIAADPSLVDRGLVVLKRQLGLGSAGRLDLLCVDQQGRLVILEIKRGTLMRDVIAQALDYASVITTWTPDAIREIVDGHVAEANNGHPGVAALLDAASDQRPDVEIIVVGCGVDANVDRMVEFLASKHSIPIRAVSFEVFALADGQRVLVRDEREAGPEEIPAAAKYSIDSVLANAGGPDSPDGRRMRVVAAAAERVGLYPKPYRYSIMLTPPQNKTRFLATIWRPASGLRMIYSADAFAEFFPFRPEDVRARLGPEELPLDSDEQADLWAANLEALFEKLAKEHEEARGDAA